MQASFGIWRPGTFRSSRTFRAEKKSDIPSDTATLYERASILDPHPAVFSQWLEWAKTRKGPGAENVAARWRQARPRDIEPLLFLISAFEKRNAFPTALRLLSEAEKIDSVNPEVRKARLRITSANFFKQVQKIPVPPVATKTLAIISEMPQTQQGDRPAFVQALHHMLALYNRDLSKAQRHQVEIERLLGGASAAAFLIIVVANACNFAIIERPELPPGDRDGLPAKLARVAALAGDLELEMTVPYAWLQEASKQFAGLSKALDIPQLRRLGECAVANEVMDFAYNVSVEGLTRGINTEAEFLLLRADAVLARGRERAMICALTAAGIARQRHELKLAAKAVDFLDETFKENVNKFDPEQIEHVLKTEKAETKFPGSGRGPTYSELRGRWCDCPSCRQARGDPVSSLDEDDEYEKTIRSQASTSSSPPGIRLSRRHTAGHWKMLLPIIRREWRETKLPSRRQRELSAKSDWVAAGKTR